MQLDPFRIDEPHFGLRSRTSIHSSLDDVPGPSKLNRINISEELYCVVRRSDVGAWLSKALSGSNISQQSRPNLILIPLLSFLYEISLLASAILE